MNQCISVREPFASMLVHGLKIEENRNFRINGKCFIHVPREIAMPFEVLEDFFREKNLNVLADLTGIHLHGDNDTESAFYSEEKGVVMKIQPTEFVQKQIDMAHCLFERNAKILKKNLFLNSCVIGEVEFYDVITSKIKQYRFANLCKNTIVYSLKESTFQKGHLGLFKIDKKFKEK